MTFQSKQKGFTIVELLIVIVVIGILAAISIVAYNGVTQKARDDGRVSDARNIINAAASYQAEKGSWPTVSELKSYDTVKLTGNAAGAQFGATVPSSPEAKDNLQYMYCTGATGSGTNPTATEPTGAALGAVTGVRVVYLKEAANNANQSMQTGTCPAIP